MKNTKNTPTVSTSARKLTVILCVALAAVLLFGGVLITVNAVRSSRAAVRYNGVSFDKGVTSFIAASFKYDYIIYLQRCGVYEAQDTEAFWSSYSIGNTTYGQMLQSELDSYVAQLAVGVYIFDRYSKMTAQDKSAVRTAVNDVLEYRASGSELAFNRLSEPMGFDFDDFEKGCEIIYKARRAQRAIYGESGSVLASGDFAEDLNRLYSDYSHVNILMIRTETDFATDTEGNRVQGNDGNDEMVTLSDEKKAERLADLATVRALIDAQGTDAESYMTPGAFREWMKKYDYDPENRDSGYYFMSGSSYTSEFGKGLPSVVSTALSMQIGEFKEVELEGGVYIFLYRYENEPLAYANSSYSRFFSDFYSLCADTLYAEIVNTLAYDVQVGNKYYEINATALPYNKELYPNF